MGNKFDKFLLLMWKNWTLLRRRPIQMAFEIILPVLICLILVGIRSLIEPTEEEQRNYEPFQATNYFFNQQLAYSPQCELVDEIMANVKPMWLNSTLIPYKNKKDMEDGIVGDLSVLVGIEFDDDLVNATELPENIVAALRFPSEQIENPSEGTRMVEEWYTNLLFSVFQTPSPRQEYDNLGGDPEYRRRGFLYVQQTLAQALLQTKNPSHQNFPDVLLNRYPYPKYHDDPFFNNMMEMMVSIVVMVAFMYNFINTIRAITTEKEKQLKESMKIMGLPGWLHWLAWFLRTFIILVIVAIIITIVLKVNFKYSPVYTKSDGSLLFVYLLIYCISIITFSFMISVFFSKANTAAAVGGLFFFLSYLPYALQQQQYDSLTLGSILGSCLLANSALSFGLSVAIKFEGIEEGVQWSNLFSTVTPDDDLTFGAVLLFLILDAVIYLLIALYVEAIFPGDFGIPQPWYFPFTKSYWCDQQKSMEINGVKANEGADFEEAPKHLPAGIQIKSLRKTFGPNVAVNDLSLDLYEGQITVLLGHNGAGKTTTMSMLTGMFPPSGGTAIISGFDVRSNIQAVRDSMGLCLQHNVLFDNLTVQEHLYFFGKLKGLKGNEIQKEIDNYIKLLELEDKRHARSSTLSGGMKRKLMVGMALCGRSKVVMLDEPTAGMDPSARRAIWDILQKQKQDRTILLTTHFMDEADLLGDRIAIMSSGRLQCCGSSFFLKKRFGAGYYLIMDISSKCVPEKVTNVLRKYIPTIAVQSHVGSELTYLLYEKDSSKFEEMLRDLEENIHSLGVESYGISLTTLEEVFMKVGADHDEEQNGNAAITIEKVGLEHLKTDIVSGLPLIGNQILAVEMKKFISTIRSWFLLLLQIILPVILYIVAVYNARAYVQDSTFPALNITLDSYQSSVTLLKSNDAAFSDVYKKALGKHKFEEVDDIASFVIDKTVASPFLVKRNYIVGVEKSGDDITAWFNGEPYHSTPLTMSLVLNTINKLVDSSIPTINFINKPLPLSAAAQANNLNFNIGGYQIATDLGFALSFSASFFILFCVKERVGKVKHLQLVSGMNIFIFWFVAFLCDLIIYLVVTAGVAITAAGVQEEGFQSSAEIGRLVLVLIYYGFAVIPFMYLVSLVFTVPSTGFSRVMLLGTVCAIVGTTAMQVLQIPALELEYVANPLHWVLLFIPFYSVSEGMIDLSSVYFNFKLCTSLEDSFGSELACQIQPTCCDFSDDYYAMTSPGIGRNLIISFTTFFLFFFILFTHEFGVFNYIINKIQNYNKPPVRNDNLEADVVEENAKIHGLSENQLKKDFILVLKDVTKYYKDFLAVNGLCLGVKPYECFGLLGVNGAGKTTTFKMMTGDESISHGNAWVGGLDINKDQKSVRKLIGYCPQFDALLDDLTAKETLIIFGLIRGVPLGKCKGLAANLAHEFDFYKHIDKKVKELSGGNKRKLSTALALIGDPPVIYLDEPTTGMDPATKRYLWKSLCKLRDNGKCIILTSHSMEECEALCTRLAIMVNGSFQCLGSTQRLKNKFAQGYALTIKVKKVGDEQNVERDVDAIESFVQRRFPGAILKEKHRELLSFQLVDNSLPWSQMFGILERSKKELNIDDYSLGQCSLEQVFLSFTKYQTVTW